MNKYIDAEKLIAEIKRLDKENKELLKSGGSIGREFLFGIGAGYAAVIKIIDSLQQDQPEVDLEKEIKNYLATKCAGDDEPSISEIARHFYELGLAARKGE